MRLNLRHFLILMFFWIILNEKITFSSIIYGIIVTLIVLLVSKGVSLKSNSINNINMLHFAYIALIEIFTSAIKHVFRIIKNTKNLEEITVSFKTKDTYILVLISSIITLSPGTVSIGIENNKIKVLAFIDSSKEETINDILKLEKPFIKNN